MIEDPVVIVGASRTPLGGFGGDLAPLSAPELGAVAISDAITKSGIKITDVNEVIMGVVLPAGQGQAPARQASIGAGMPKAVGATTINKMCGSGMKAAMLAHDNILSGTHEIMVAGGMESMSNAPYLLPDARSGMRMGHGQLNDHMFIDGLEDAYDKGTLMGVYAENTAEAYQFTRDAQDEFSITSLKRALLAAENGYFSDEIVPITVQSRKAETVIKNDEQPRNARPEKIPELRPAFREHGTVTAANSSSISDGAAALILVRRSEAEKQGLTPLAAIHGHATHAQDPEWFTTAPIEAINKVLEKASWNKDEVDLFEINEAFAVVTMAAMKDLGLSHDKVNVHGGACALGHPVGATGARIIVTLLHALSRNDLKKGVASLCIGGGEATAIAIERLN